MNMNKVTLKMVCSNTETHFTTSKYVLWCLMIFTSLFP